MSDTEIEALHEPSTWDEVFDPARRAALRLADALCAGPDALDDELVAELRDHFAEAELAELILVCGQANLNNRAGNAAKRLLGPSEGDEGAARSPGRSRE